MVDQIKAIGRDRLLIEETMVQARRQAEDQMERLRAERAGLVRRLREDQAALGRLAVTPGAAQLADANDRIREAERRLTEIENELVTLDGDRVSEREVAAALADFDALWDTLAPGEQVRIVELLVEGVAYDGHAGSISITFRSAGIRTLVGELARREEELV